MFSGNITITISTSDSISVTAFGVSGSANYTSPFDSNTVTSKITGKSIASSLVSTTSTNDFVIAILGGNGSPTITEPNSYTLIGTQQNAPMLNVSYNVVLGTLTNQTISWTSSSNTNTWETIICAISGATSSGGNVNPSTSTSLTLYVSPPISSVWHLSGFSTQFQSFYPSSVTLNALNSSVTIGGNFPSQAQLPLTNAGLLLAGSQSVTITVPTSGIVQATGGVSQQPFYNSGQQNILHLPWNTQIDVTNNDLIQVYAAFSPSGITPGKLFWAFLGYQEPL